MKDSDIETKIDELAEMVARGFSEVRDEFKAVRQEFGEDLAELRKEMRETFATKEDLIRLRGDIDIMLDRHIGTFRKDYDDLAARVKHLEQLVLK